MARIILSNNGKVCAEIVIDEATRSVDIVSGSVNLLFTDRKQLAEFGCISKLARTLSYLKFRELGVSHPEEFEAFEAIDRITKAMDREAATAKRQANKQRVAELEKRVAELEAQNQ